MGDCKVISHKKGFTIVELVIVIAVIAILAAVAVPAFSGVVNKAKISVVSQLAANFNKAVASCEAEDGSILTMHDVMCALEEFGFDESDAIDDKGDYCVVWDSEQNRFVVFDKDEKKVCSEEESSTPLTKLWQVVDEIPDEADTSLYLTESIDVDTVSAEVGVDVGDNEEVEKIIYTDTDEEVKDIIIRVNDPATEVDLTNKGNDNVTVIGLNNSPESVTPPTDETPGNTDDPEGTDAPEPTDEPIEDDKSYLIPKSEDKVVYSVVMNEQYDSLDNAATIGGELILIANVKEASIEIKNDVILDLNGFTVGYFDSETNEDSDDTIIIDGGSLVIKDSSAPKLGAIRNKAREDANVSAIRIKNGGSLTLESGTVSGTKCAIYCEDGTSAIIDGGEIRGVGEAGMGIYVSNSVNLTVNGGYIVTEKSSEYAIGAKDIMNDYLITVNGGLIEGTIRHGGKGNLVINDGTIRGVDAAIVMRKGTLEINGGELSTNSNISKSKGYMPTSNGDNFEQVGAVIHVDATSGSSKQIKINITINGGNFVSKNFHIMCFTGQDQDYLNNKPVLTIKGGIFISPEDYETIVYRHSVLSSFSFEVNTVSKLKV